MRKKIITRSLFLLMTIMLVLTGCSNNGEEEIGKEPENPNTVVEEPDTKPNFNGQAIILNDMQKSAVGNNNDFAFNFYRTVSQSKDLKGKSNVISPLSMTYLLGMLNAGAIGQTSKELQTLLGFADSDASNINALCNKLIKEMPKVDEVVSLSIANLMAIDHSLTLEEQYKKDMNRFYEAEVASLPFGSKESVDYINDWSNKHTEGLIPHLVDNLNGVMALMNAVYINAPWTEIFVPQNTKNEEFVKEDGERVTLPMMNGGFRGTSYTKTQNYEVLRKPYGLYHNWAMYILLPKEGRTIDDILPELTNASWVEVLQGMENCPVKVKMPRFKTENDIIMNKILEEMGTPSMFQPMQEFPLISSSNKDLFVNIVQQKVTINVKEEGTEAAAVSLGIMTGSNGSEPQFINFHATRPFVYLIQEDSSGTIFFIGTYQGD